MRVLLIGANGNLGLRVLPALLSHGHIVIAFVRTPDKLQSLVTSDLFDRIAVFEGDALDTGSVESALRTYDIEAVVQTSGNRESPWKEQTMSRLATSISTASINVGKERGRPLRAWFIGGLGSLAYPGTRYRIDDYLPAWMSEHMRGTEAVVKALPTTALAWSMLCVAIMKPESDVVDVLPAPRVHQLSVKTGSPPDWKDSWVRQVPLVGLYLNLYPTVSSYTAKYEEVGGLLAASVGEAGDGYIGQLVGYKATDKAKSA